MKIKKITTTIYVDEDTKTQYQFEPVEDTTTKGGNILKYLTPDTSAESPNTWGNEEMFLVYYHRDFWVERKEFPKEYLARIYRDTLELDSHWIFSVSAYIHYIHSGVVLSLAGSFSYLPRNWDTSNVGAIFVEKKSFPKREEAYKAAEDLITTWNQYLSGDVYCCVSENLATGEYDIVGGFYGLEFAKESLKEI